MILIINQKQMSTLGQRTTLLKRTLGMTQKEFAKTGSFSQSNLSLLENDGVVPNLGFILRISEAFPQISLDWWLMGKGNMLVTRPDPEIENIKNLSDAKKVLNELRGAVEEMKYMRIVRKGNSG